MPAWLCKSTWLEILSLMSSLLYLLISYSLLPPLWPWAGHPSQPIFMLSSLQINSYLRAVHLGSFDGIKIVNIRRIQDQINHPAQSEPMSVQRICLPLAVPGLASSSPAMNLIWSVRLGWSDMSSYNFILVSSEHPLSYHFWSWLCV